MIKSTKIILVVGGISQKPHWLNAHGTYAIPEVLQHEPMVRSQADFVPKEIMQPTFLNMFIHTPPESRAEQD